MGHIILLSGFSTIKGFFCTEDVFVVVSVGVC